MKNKKFIFTQISAPFIGGGSVILGAMFFRKHFPIQTFTLLTTVLTMVGFLVVLVGSILLWGRILVLLGILTKEEAKGYPFSKPWEQ
ncbi:hypothetical protein ACFL1E_04080 [Candidatus Omnitrophota bacterium]